MRSTMRVVDRRASVRAAVALAERTAARPRSERVSEDALVRGLRALAPGANRGCRGRNQSASRLRLRRLPPTASDGSDRLPLPSRGVATQGDRARRARPAAVSGLAQHPTLTVDATASVSRGLLPKVAMVEHVAPSPSEFHPRRGLGVTRATGAAPGAVTPRLGSEDAPRGC